MKKDILKLLYMGSVYSIIGLLGQVLLINVVFASSSDAQEIKSVKEVTINVRFQDVKLLNAFQEIESKTDFHFVFDKKDSYLNQTINVQGNNTSVEVILLEISKQAGLGFHQINRNISVEKKEGVTKIEVIIQGITITGRVTSFDDNDGLPGVNVIVKGTSLGTVTDVEGRYSLEVPDRETILQFSSVGYIKEEIEVGNQAVIDLELVTDVTSLDEIIVLGYGTQEKSKLIGSVSQLKSKEVNDRSVPQLQQALVGQMPGVTVIQRSGQPGNPGGSIQIRGVSSVSSSNAPLILVDGIPTDSYNDIDPNVVENISVLKDASSAAIYGSRAANGVILITTKMAKSDEVKVSYNGYVGIQTPTEYPEFVDSWEYGVLLNEANTNDGLPATYSPEEIETFKNGSDPDNYPNSDFVQEVLKKKSMQTGHNILLSNSLGSSNYLLSLGYLYQNGIVDKNDYNRYNIRLNVISEITPTLQLTTRINGIQTKDKQPSGPATLSNANTMLGIIGQTVRYPPIYPIKLSNGDWGGGFEQSGTPASFLASDSFYEEERSDVGINMKLDWTIIPDLKFSVIGGYTDLNSESQRFSASQRITSTNTLGPANSDVAYYGQTYRTLQELLQYDKIFGDNSISILAGHTYESEYIESTSAYRQGFPNNDITVLDAGSSEGMSNTGTAREWALDSYIGRIRYSFRNKYLMEGVVRYDGSSRFPPSNKYATFPSVALGWRLSEENFIKNNLKWLDELKLKGSWGRLGSQALNGAAGFYPYQNIISSGYNYPFGNVINTGVARTRIVDSDLKWETTEAIDFGLDASVKNGLLTFSATYFNKKSIDLLVLPGNSVSDVLGFDVGHQNSGSSRNRGFEFTLGHTNNIGDFSYFINSNLTILNNEILDLGVANIQQPNGLIGNGSDLFIGEPLNLYYGYQSDGLFVDQNDIDNYADQKAINSKPRPGDIRYKDISGPDGVPDGNVDATYDRIVLGTQIPKHSYGINLGAGYKGLTFSVLIQGVGGVSGRLDNASGLAFVNQGGIQRWMADERWSPENPNPDAGYPRLEIIPNGGTANSLLSSFWVLNASYLKVRNIQLAYNLPKQMIESIGFNNVQFRLSAENLISINQYRKGWDPEVNANLNYYPILANYTLGLKVDF